jgi:hypothetical protein
MEQTRRTISTVAANTTSMNMSVDSNGAMLSSCTGEACCVCYASTCSRTPCGHVLCVGCHMELRRALCPICRRKLPTNGREESDSDSDDDDRLTFSRQNALVARTPSPSGMGYVSPSEWHVTHRRETPNDDGAELAMDRHNAYRSDDRHDRIRLPPLRTQGGFVAREHHMNSQLRRGLFGNICDAVDGAFRARRLSHC